MFLKKNDHSKYLVIRGTEDLTDILADGILASAIPPIFNPQFIALRSQLNTWLNDPNVLQGERFTMTGHSLGGYLAAAAKQIYPQITETYLYHGPGVGGLQGNLIEAIHSVLGLEIVTTDNIWNLRGSEGFPIIAGLGYQLGTPVTIQIEAAFNNHSIVLQKANFQQNDHSFLLKIFLSSI